MSRKIVNQNYIIFYIKCCFETKSYERRIVHANDNCEQSLEHTDTDEDNSDQDSDEDARHGFQRTVENGAPLKNRNIAKAMKRPADGKAANKEYEILVASSIECKVKWKKLHTKKELNLDDDEKIDTCKYLWSINMKTLQDHTIKESGEEHKFGFLPEMC